MIAALSLLGPVAGAVGDVVGNAVTAMQTQPTTATDDFSSVLGQVANDAMTKLKTGENAAVAGIQGHAPVQEVVQSVLDAQGALQTAVAVRDKVVSAYQEVTRMSI